MKSPSDALSDGFSLKPNRSRALSVALWGFDLLKISLFCNVLQMCDILQVCNFTAWLKTRLALETYDKLDIGTKIGKHNTQNDSPH